MKKFVVYDYYQITKVLGQGAYAVVAEAIDKRNGQKVAIKKKIKEYLVHYQMLKEYYVK